MLIKTVAATNVYQVYIEDAQKKKKKKKSLCDLMNPQKYNKRMA